MLAINSTGAVWTPEIALRRRGRIAAGAAAADLFCTPENIPDGHLKKTGDLVWHVIACAQWL